MTKEQWQIAIESIQAEIGEPSVELLELATRLSLPISRDTPLPVAQSIVRRRLQQTLGLRKSGEPSEGSLEWLAILERETNSELVGSEGYEVVDQQDVKAWARVMSSKLLILRLQENQPKPGDIIQYLSPSDSFMGILSSVSKNGALQFRGNFGRRSRFEKWEIASREGENGYEECLRNCDNYIANLKIGSPSRIGRFPDLEEFRIDDDPSNEYIDHIEHTLQNATSEGEMQRVIALYPSVLASLTMGHHARYLFIQPRLGTKYVPDFMLAGVSSEGIRWTLIELESPVAEMTIRDGRPNEIMRNATNQIAEWREWLTQNIAYASKPKSEFGLGFSGIRSDADGLVIMSRSHMAADGENVRRRIWVEQRIRIITYDNLIASLRQRVNGQYLNQNILDEIEDAQH